VPQPPCSREHRRAPRAAGRHSRGPLLWVPFLGEARKGTRPPGRDPARPVRGDTAPPNNRGSASKHPLPNPLPPAGEGASPATHFGDGAHAHWGVYSLSRWRERVGERACAPSGSALVRAAVVSPL